MERDCQCCGNCRFWVGVFRPTYKNSNEKHELCCGTCVRNPPIGTTDDGFGYWPRTWQNDWCGKYQISFTDTDLSSIR